MRHLLACHRGDELSAQAAAPELGLSRTGFYKLYSQSLRACAQDHAETWSPGLSGGDHQVVCAMFGEEDEHERKGRDARKRIVSKPPRRH
jgi:hypothetical protein